MEEGHFSGLTFTEYELDSKHIFKCLSCSQRCTSKRRILTHIASIHKDEQKLTGCKEDCYSITKIKTGENERKLFQCHICQRTLSSKQRIQHHLYIRHGKSPIAKVYGRYEDDPSNPVPDRTARRRLNANSKHHETGGYDSSDSSDGGSDVSGIELLEDSIEKNLLSDNEPLNDYDLLSVLDNSLEHLASNEQASSIYVNDSGEETNCDSEKFQSSVESSDSENSDYNSERSSSSSITTDSDTNCLSSENDIDIEPQIKEPFSEEESLSLCTSAYVTRFNIPGEATKYLEKLLTLKPGATSSPNVKQQHHTSSNFDVVSYCSTCFSVFEGDNYICEINNCGNFRYKGGLQSQTSRNRQPKTSFIIADIESQLKQMLERKGMWKNVQLMKRKSRLGLSSVCDIIDGECYRNLCAPGEFLNKENNISAIFNTDGVPLYSSSHVKLWPIFLAINEIPVQARFSRENIIFGGIWQGKEKPPFVQYMWTFGEKMCKLKDVGVTINPYGYDGSVNVKVILLCATVDLQAKGYILNMSMHNGAYGCSTCEEMGVTEKQGKGSARFYPPRDEENQPPFRNSDDLKYVKGTNATRNSRIKGICGISGLSVMPWFDMVSGFVPDYMHGVLMGITKKLLYLWFSPTSTGKPYFVGKSLKKISDRFQKIFPPDYIERLPRDLEKHYGHLKATELQTWLLFYSIPCMNGILPDEYHAHLCLLSEGIYLLLGDNITEEELERAGDLLAKFYKNFPDLYNKGSCGLNVHNIGAHLAYFVRQWGPLWAWSCFPFEDANAALLTSVHGTGDVTLQCLRMKELQLKMKNIDLDRIVSQDEKLFITKMTKSARTWKTTKMNNCSTTGSKMTLDNCDNIEFLMECVGVSSAADIKKVLRVEVNGEKLYSQEYKRMKKRICYVVCTNDGKILSIQFFAVNIVTKKVFAICDQLCTTPDCFFNAESGRHIMKVRKEDNTVVISVDKIKEKAFYMEIDGNTYISRMPNLFGHCVFK